LISPSLEQVFMFKKLCAHNHKILFNIYFWKRHFVYKHLLTRIIVNYKLLLFNFNKYT